MANKVDGTKKGDLGNRGIQGYVHIGARTYYYMAIWTPSYNREIEVKKGNCHVYVFPMHLLTERSGQTVGLVLVTCKHRVVSISYAFEFHCTDLKSLLLHQSK